MTSSSVTGQSGSSSATTTNSYIWYDGAVQSRITYQEGSNPLWTTDLVYDGAARLRLARIQDGKARDVEYVTDELGQVVYRKQVGAIAGQTGGPHEVSYRFGGRQLGFTGNDGSTNMGMAASIADRQQVAPASQGTFRNKQVTGTGHADFAQSYDALNSYNQGSVGGGYTVQAGDTLQGIAYQVWGDGALWYKIAEANGLNANSMLIAGQQLTLPSGVTRTAHNAATMRPYDPADALGNLVPDTSPAPAPAARKKSNKCGVFGAILLAVVAVAVAVASVGTLGPVGAAVLGSAVSQGVGLATGIQSKFSFKGLAIAALSAGVATGVGQVVGQGAIAGSQFLGDVARGALGSAITQGVGVATGLQDKFDWAGVAAAGIGAGVGGAAMRGLGRANGRYDQRTGSWGWKEGYTPSFGIEAAGGAAALIANAATRSAISGNSFGDNILAALPDTLGNLLGGRIGRALQGSGRSQARDDNRAGAQAENSPSPAVQDPTAQANANPTAGAGPTEGEGWANVVVTAAKRTETPRAAIAGALAGVDALKRDLNVRSSPGTVEIADGATRRTKTPWPAEFQDAYDKSWARFRDAPNGANLIADQLDPLAQQMLGGLLDRASIEGQLASYRKTGIYDTRGFTFGTESQSLIQQALGIAANSAEGTFALSYIDGMSMGTVSLLDSNGALGIMQAQSPNAATAGSIASIVAGLGGGVKIGRGLVATETKLAGGTFDLGVNGSQYTLKAPTISGYENATGTIRAFGPKSMLPESGGALGHIFKARDGHIIDTPQNRQLLDFVAQNPATTLGPDRYGAVWSSMTLPNNTQAWTRVLNGRIINGGINLTPKTYNPLTGLSSPVKP